MSHNVVKCAANFIYTLMSNANNDIEVNSPATVVHKAISELTATYGFEVQPRMEIITEDPKALFMFMARLAAQLIAGAAENDTVSMRANMQLILAAYTGTLNENYAEYK